MNDYLNSYVIGKVECDGTSNFSNLTNCIEFDWSSPYSLPFIMAVSLLMVALSLVTIFGNLMVLLSFYIDKKIREPSNYFIFSLALSDFMIGLEGFPLYTVYVLHGQKWTMGWFMCDLWLSIDYAVCLASIYTVLFITIDRFCSVKIPTVYRNWRTKRRISIIVVIIWIIPSLLFFISVFGWEHFSGRGRILQSHECEVQFMKNPYFNMSMYISYYWSTLVVMIILYGGIYQAARKLQMKSHQRQRRLTAAAAMKANVASVSVCFAPINNLPDSVRSRSITNNDDHTCRDSANCASSAQKLISQDGTENSKSSSQLTVRGENNKNDDETLPIISSFFNKSALENSKQRSSSSLHSAVEALRSFYRKTSDSILRRTTETSNMDKSKLSSVKKSKSLEHPMKSSIRERLSCSQLEKIFEEEVTEVNTTSFQNKLYAEQTPIFQSPSAYSNYKFESFDNQSLNINDAKKEDASSKQCCSQIVLAVAEEKRRTVSEPAVTAFIDSDRYALNSEDEEDEMEETEISVKKNEAASYSRTSSPFISLLEELYDTDISGDFINLAMQQAVSNLCTLAPKDDSNLFAEENNREKVPYQISAISPLSDQCERKTNRNNTDRAAANCKKKDTSTPLLPKVVSFDRASEIYEDDDDNSSIARKDSPDDPITKEAFSDKTLLQTLNRIQKKTKGKSKIYSFLRRKRSGRRMYKKSKSENRARKALRTITIILGAFVLFWTPFYVLATMYGFCTECIPPWLFITSYYMCYMNSPINPFCYAMANAQFKKTFSRMLRGDFHRA